MFAALGTGGWGGQAGMGITQIAGGSKGSQRGRKLRLGPVPCWGMNESPQRRLELPSSPQWASAHSIIHPPKVPFTPELLVSPDLQYKKCERKCTRQKCIKNCRSQLVEHAKLDLQVMSTSLILGGEII